MPRDFKSFCNEQKNILKDDPEKTKDISEMLNRYKDMNQSELMQNLFTEAGKLKKEGKLNETTLNNFEQIISPFLNEEQKEMLSSIIDKIK